jgi:hypothetical protein
MYRMLDKALPSKSMVYPSGGSRGGVGFGGGMLVSADRPPWLPPEKGA